MAYLWDPFPFPLVADDDAKKTFAGVGMVMTAWESIEFEFARLYSIFVGDEPDGFLMREYGDPRVANRRIGELSRSANQFFIGWPHQGAEGEYTSLVATAMGFANRRNDVAHGMVMNIENIVFFQQQVPGLDRSKPQFLLVPPFHILRNHDAATGMPSYAYNSAQLAELFSRLLDLVEAIRQFRVNLLGAQQAAPPTP